MKVSDIAGAQLILCSHSFFFFSVLIKINKKKKTTKKKHFPEDKLAHFTLESYHQQHKTNGDALQTLTVPKFKYLNVAIGVSTEKSPPVEHPHLQDAVSGDHDRSDSTMA